MTAQLRASRRAGAAKRPEPASEHSCACVQPSGTLITSPVRAAGVGVDNPYAVSKEVKSRAALNRTYLDNDIENWVLGRNLMRGQEEAQKTHDTITG